MSENNYASITWAIHNYSYCWQKYDEAIVSPAFCINMPEETKWKLMLFPRGMAPNPDCISFFLYRDKDCCGAEKIDVEYRLNILASDGSCLVDLLRTDEFRKDTRNGSWRCVHQNDVIEENSKYLPRNIFTVLCKIIRFDGKTVEMKQIFVRTIFGIENRFFQSSVENFSKMTPDQTHSFIIKSKSKEIIMQINLFLSSDNEDIYIAIDSFDQCKKFSAVKSFVIDSQKQKNTAGGYDYWPSCGKNMMFPLNLTKKDLIKNENLYLPDDKLTLSFELTVSTGFDFEGIENPSCEYTSYPFLNETIENWRKCFAHKNLSDCPCALITDLNYLYQDQSTCDMKLKTKTNTFLVHSLILSARSPVFKAMFSNDMKEKINGCFNASDLDDGTVRRFLSYLYSDQLEDLTWDNALQLYKAADKYAVISLRDKCSAFLKSNLNLENACEALVLSDMHHDNDLKEIALNSILKNAKVIFKSEKWKLLAKNNPQLALETTLRNWNEE